MSNITLSTFTNSKKCYINLARLLEAGDGGENIPLPITLDAHLRFRPDSKLCANFKAGVGRQPTIFTSLASLSDVGWSKRRDVLEQNGIKVIEIPAVSGK